MTRARMTFATIIAMLAIATTTGAFAQPQQARPDLGDPVSGGRYLRPGPGLACKIEAPNNLSPEQIKALSEHSCLRVGPLVVGMEVAALKALLGQPARQRQGAKDTTVWVYFFGRTNDDPYLVASIWQDRLVAIQ